MNNISLWLKVQVSVLDAHFGQCFISDDNFTPSIIRWSVYLGYKWIHWGMSMSTHELPVLYLLVNILPNVVIFDLYFIDLNLIGHHPWIMIHKHCLIITDDMNISQTNTTDKAKKLLNINNDYYISTPFSLGSHQGTEGHGYMHWGVWLLCKINISINSSKSERRWRCFTWSV